MHRTTVAGDEPTAPEGDAVVAPARPADVAWARAPLEVA
jgi:hypothetical protein